MRSAAAVGVGLFGLYFVLGRMDPHSVILDLGREDGPVEDLAAVFWAAASVACIVRLVQRQRQARLLLGFWAVFAFVCLGEEVSWFQRVLDIQTPTAIATANMQGELNIHNLTAVDYGPLVNVQYAFLAGFLWYFLVLPVLTRQRLLGAWAAKLGYEAPDAAFWWMIASVIGVSYAVQALGADAAVRVIAETRETFYAFVVLAYVGIYVCAPRLSPADSRRASLAS